MFVTPALEIRDPLSVPDHGPGHVPGPGSDLSPDFDPDPGLFLSPVVC